MAQERQEPQRANSSLQFSEMFGGPPGRSNPPSKTKPSRLSEHEVTGTGSKQLPSRLLGWLWAEPPPFLPLDSRTCESQLQEKQYYILDTDSKHTQTSGEPAQTCQAIATQLRYTLTVSLFYNILMMMIILHVWVFWMHVCLCAICTYIWCPGRPEEGWPLTDSCEPYFGCW